MAHRGESREIHVDQERRSQSADRGLRKSRSSNRVRPGSPAHRSSPSPKRTKTGKEVENDDALEVGGSIASLVCGICIGCWLFSRKPNKSKTPTNIHSTSDERTLPIAEAPDEASNTATNKPSKSQQRSSPPCANSKRPNMDKSLKDYVNEKSNEFEWGNRCYRSGQASNSPLDYSRIQETRNGQGQTAIHVAAMKAHTDVFENVLKSISKPRQARDLLMQKDDYSYTPIHWAIMKGNISIVVITLRLYPKSLLEILRIQEFQRLSCLHLAIREKRFPIVEELVSALSDLDLYELMRMKDDRDSTPLHQAVKDGSIDIIKKILTRVSPGNRYELLKLEDDDGSTPVHIAVKNLNTEALFGLKDFVSAEQLNELVHITDNNGKTVIDYVKNVSPEHLPIILSALSLHDSRY